MTDPRFLNSEAPMGLRHYPDDLESAGVVGRHGEWAWLITGLHRLFWVLSGRRCGWSGERESGDGVPEPVG